MRQDRGFWAVLVGLLLFLGKGFGQGAPRESEPDAGRLKDSLRSLFDDGDNVDILASGETLFGTVSRGEREILGISVVEQPGVGFPDLVLTLDVTNPAADADIYCLPWSVTQQIGGLPSPRDNIWKSDHQQGLDVVFVSKNHSFFDITVSNQVTGEGTSERTSDMVCVILGHSMTEAQYEVTLQLDFEQRTLVEEEMDVVKRIYSSCCEDGNYCQRWSAVSLEVQGGPSQGVEYDLCHMHNSFCDEDGHLVRLDMSTFGLECAFPSKEIAKLTRLKKLLLNRNFLSGDINTILDDLKALPDLDELVLRENKITGSLTSPSPTSGGGVCGLVRQSLQVLNLDNNQIEGPIPPCLFESGSKLLSVFLDANPLNSGIPDIFPDGSLIEHLSVADCGIVGSIPTTLANLKNLVAIDFRGNELDGSIPATFVDSPHLVSVALQSNELVGSVPDVLALSRTLRFLNLNDNNLSELPAAWFERLPTSERLFNLGLARNRFEGTFPVSIAFAPSLVALDLKDNMMSGSLPDFLDSFPRAVILDFSQNKFTGPIPEAWSTMGLFAGTTRPPFGMPAFLDLSDNELSGPIPQFLLESGTVPLSLSRGGVNVTGNSLACVEEERMAYLDHFDGLEACTEKSEAQVVEPEEGTREIGPAILSEANVVEEPRRYETKKSSSGNRVTIIVVVVAIVGILLAAVLVALVVMRVKSRRAHTRAVDAIEGKADAKAMKNIEFEVFQDNV